MSDARLEFNFLQCLGKGGFGEVYLATVKRPGGIASKMAVKVLKDGLDNEDEAVSRLRDEGRMLAILDHPAILRVHDMCRLGGRIALVMEYVEGIDLARVCKADRLLPPRVVVATLGEVASALHKAWVTISPETGRPLHLVHRDLKPENIRLTVHGQVKLLDFGIARSSEMARDAKTRAGDLPFTPGYAAPESFRLGEQGPESDIYALGCTMYRVLAAERFYEGQDLSDQFGIASRAKEYEPFLAERMKKIAHVPAPVFELCKAMLAWDKTQRPTADQARTRCEDLAETLPGPTLQKWARTYDFAPPKELKDPTLLTGRTMKEDGPNGPVPGESRDTTPQKQVGAPRLDPKAALASMPPPPRSDTPRRSLHSQTSVTPSRSAPFTPSRSPSLPGETPARRKSSLPGEPPIAPPKPGWLEPAPSVPPPVPPSVRTATPRPAVARSATPAPVDARSISPAASRSVTPAPRVAPKPKVVEEPEPGSGGLRLMVVVGALGAVGFLLLAVFLIIATILGLSW